MPTSVSRRGFLDVLGGMSATVGTVGYRKPADGRGSPRSVLDTVGGATPSTETQWAETYGPRFFSSEANSVIGTSDGGYLFAGHIELGYGRNAWLVETDTGGTALWENEYSQAFAQSVNSVIDTSTGGYLLAGWRKSGSNAETDGWLVKVDTEGTVRWEQTYTGGYAQTAHSVIETTDGAYLVTGAKQTDENGGSDAWLLTADTDGTTTWERTYGGSENDGASSVLERSNGGYLLAGAKETNRNVDAWLLQVDTEGNPQWERTYGGSEPDAANSVIETSDGGYLVASVTASSGNGQGDAWLVKVDPDGTVQWQTPIGGVASDTAETVIETINGSYLFAGTTASSGNAKKDGWVGIVDTDGTIRGTQTYGGNDHDWTNSVIETNDGGVLLAGATTSDVEKQKAWLAKVGDIADISSQSTTPSTASGDDDTAQNADRFDPFTTETGPGSQNGNTSGSSGLLLPFFAIGAVGWIIGFITGNTESEKIKREVLNTLLVGFGGAGLLGLIRAFLKPGGDKVALLVGGLALGLFAGMVVGIYLRKKGFTISS